MLRTSLFLLLQNIKKKLNIIDKPIINENKLIIRSPSSLIIVSQKNTNKKSSIKPLGMDYKTGC